MAALYFLTSKFERLENKRYILGMGLYQNVYIGRWPVQNRTDFKTPCLVHPNQTWMFSLRTWSQYFKLSLLNVIAGSVLILSLQMHENWG